MKESMPGQSQGNENCLALFPGGHSDLTYITLCIFHTAYVYSAPMVWMMFCLRCLACHCLSCTIKLSGFPRSSSQASGPEHGKVRQYALILPHHRKSCCWTLISTLTFVMKHALCYISANDIFNIPGNSGEKFAPNRILSLSNIFSWCRYKVQYPFQDFEQPSIWGLALTWAFITCIELL